MMRIPNSKITEQDITYGPTDPDAETAIRIAEELTKLGYRKTSNAYCLVSRIDREDWLEVLAKQRHCSRADFYNVDGSGISDSHKEHYIRVHSKDNLTVHPNVYKNMLRYFG